MRTATATAAVIGGESLVVWLHTAEDPRPDDWAIGIETTEALKRKLGLAKLRSLVVTDGGAPNVAQRRQLQEQLFEGRPSKLVVISNSLTNPVKRGIATAIGWLNPSFKAVLPERWEDALAHVGVLSHAAELLVVLRGLQKELPPVKTLEDLERLTTTGLGVAPR